MLSISLEQLVLMAVLVGIVVTLRPPPSFWRRLEGDLRRLDHELEHRFRHRHWPRMPVFSAETIRRKEAEFIRDRLRRGARRNREQPSTVRPAAGRRPERQ